MIRDRRRSASNYTASYNGLIEVLGLTHDHFGVVAILMCIRSGGWTLFDLIRIGFFGCHVVYTWTEILKVFCIEEIVVVLVYQ